MVVVEASAEVIEELNSSSLVPTAFIPPELRAQSRRRRVSNQVDRRLGS